MSRKKAASSEATPKPINSAVPPASDTATQSTLGDGDAAGAAAQASDADAAPNAPTQDVASALDPDGNPPSTEVPQPTVDLDRGPDGWTVTVVGPTRGRWRAGRKFGPEPTLIPAAELTEEDMAKLVEDPELVVTMTEDAV